MKFECSFELFDVDYVEANCPEEAKKLYLEMIKDSILTNDIDSFITVEPIDD